MKLSPGLQPGDFIYFEKVVEEAFEDFQKKH